MEQSYKGRLALPRRDSICGRERTNNAEAESKQLKFVMPRHFGFLMAAMSNITEAKCQENGSVSSGFNNLCHCQKVMDRILRLAGKITGRTMRHDRKRLHIVMCV